MKYLSVLFLLTFISSHVCKQPNDRIFDGSQAQIDAFPWMVSIRFGFSNQLTHVCGGAILSDIYVVTGASCFQQLTLLPSLFSLKAGIYNIYNGSESTEQLRSISQILTHPFYTSERSPSNIALVRVSQPFNFETSSVSNISLSNLTSLEDMDLITIGWGLTTNQSNSSMAATFLQQRTVQENVQCTKNNSVDPTLQLCATGTCQGDSGGPLMVYQNDSQQYELVGITSFRNACTTEGLFTRIAPFYTWILETMKNPPSITLFPPLITFTTIAPPTPKPDVLGPPIQFICNASYSCGCSPTPVIFHDEPPFPSNRRYVQGRIVGGENAQPHSWPWIISIRTFNVHFCGGSILNNQWILTAAHCFQNAIGITVHIGVHNESSPSPQIRTIDKLIIHPMYQPPPRYVNDIALLRLSSPIDLTASENYAGLTCLPKETVDVLDYPKVNTSLAVIGWGRLLTNGIRPKLLRQVRVKTLANNDSRCAGSINDTERQFCAMVDNGGKDSCQGDSGGPIHQWLGDHWEQVGIVSYGKGCALPDHPGVYTRLAFYYHWIQSTINQDDTTTISSNLTSTIFPALTNTTTTVFPALTNTSTMVSALTNTTTTTVFPALTNSSTMVSALTNTSTMFPATTNTSTVFAALTNTSTMVPATTKTSEPSSSLSTVENWTDGHGTANMLKTNLSYSLVLYLLLLSILLI